MVGISCAPVLYAPVLYEKDCLEEATTRSHVCARQPDPLGDTRTQARFARAPVVRGLRADTGLSRLDARCCCVDPRLEGPIIDEEPARRDLCRRP